MITPEMSIPEIVEKFPGTREVFKRHGIYVDGYKALDHENLIATSKVHQLNLDDLVAELNKVAK